VLVDRVGELAVLVLREDRTFRPWAMIFCCCISLVNKM
jgi:hypothetical protein